MPFRAQSSGNIPITLWMNMPSHHQDGPIGCLDGTPGVDGVIYDGETAACRRDLGWRAEPRQYRHTFLSGCKPLAAVRAVGAASGRIHIFNGIWAVPSFAAALAAHLAHPGAPCFVYSEAPNRDVKRAVLRCALRDALGRALARSPRCAVLAVSRLAEDFYRSLGFPPHRIYSFAYFRDAAVARQPLSPAGLRLVFVGQLCAVKGLDLLLDALDPLCDALPALSLDLIGAGPGQPLVERYRELHPRARIRLRGVLPSVAVSRGLAAYDLPVLPSRGDGWGVVVNEALAAGLPVIVSDACGSADVVRDGINGFVFRSGDSAALENRIRAFARRSPAGRARMASAAEATGEALAPHVAARYLSECIRHSLHGGAKPTAPWTQAHDLCTPTSST